jgi:hypothetical protein
MSSFTEPLILEAMPAERNGRGLFRVYESFWYEIGHVGSNDWVLVPKGYVTDLCSIPSFARPFFPLAGRVAKPALLHDWLLDNGDPRAADVFDEALRVAGVKPTTRRIMVAAVRLWRRYQDMRQRFGLWWKGSPIRS